MDKNLFGIFVHYLERERLIVDYFHVAACSLFFYDYLLTVHTEIKTIWLGSNWNYTKVLFLLTRYLPMAVMYLVLRDQMFLNVPAHSCKAAYTAVTWLIVIGIACAEAILAIRTYAVWHQDRFVGILLVALQIAVFVINSFSASRFLDSITIAPTPYPGFRGCFVAEASKILYLNFLALAVSQTIVLGLMCIRSYRAYQAGHMNELSQVIHRDGLLFYFYLLVVAYINLFVVLFTPTEFEVVLTPLQGVTHSIFTARIIMNIRDLGNQDQGNMTLTEFHDTRVLPLAFRSLEMDRAGVYTQTEDKKSADHTPC